jgi:hypothetical protein
MSSVCEAFSCLPVAGGALDQPVWLTRRIMLYRNYKMASAMVKGEVPVPEDGPPEDVREFVGRVIDARRAEDERLEALDDAEEAG